MPDITAHAEAILRAGNVSPHSLTFMRNQQSILTAVRALAEDAARSAIEAAVPALQAIENPYDGKPFGHSGAHAFEQAMLLALGALRNLSPADIVEQPK